MRSRIPLPWIAVRQLIAEKYHIAPYEVDLWTVDEVQVELQLTDIRAASEAKRPKQPQQQGKPGRVRQTV